MRKLTLLLLCLALGIGVCDAKKKNRGVYFRTDAEIVLDKPYGRMYGNERVRIRYSLQKPDDVCVGYVDLQRAGGMRGYSDGGGIWNEPGGRGFYVPGFGLYADRYVRL